MKKTFKRLSAVLLEVCFLIELLSGVAVASDVIQQRMITGFKSLPANESVVEIPVDKKSTLAEILTLMPTTLDVYLDGNLNQESIPVSWFCISGDYEQSEYYYYQFSPKWDESKYTLDPSIELLTGAPYIAVFIIEDTDGSGNTDYINGTDACSYKGNEYFCNYDDEYKLYAIETESGDMRLVMNEHILIMLTHYNFLYVLAYDDDESTSLIRFNMDTASHETVLDFPDAIISMARRGQNIYFATDDGIMRMDLTTYTMSQLIGGNKIAMLYFADADTLKYYTKDGKNSEFLFFNDEIVPSEGSTAVFVDIDKNAYYYNAVLWAVERDVTKGKSETTFDPSGTCTRAQTVTFLWRFAGSPETHADNPFLDVGSDAYYYKAVLWAVEQGITNGKSATSFSPDDTVSRAQAVTFLYRMRGATSVDGNRSFSDVAHNSYYEKAVSWAVQNSITNGKSSTIFAPDDYCSRGQIVTFLYRLHLSLPEDGI